ncbi:MAG: Ig-like domain-containing protein [Luteolibacter sp.]
MRKHLTSFVSHTGITPLPKPSANKLLLSLLVAAATAGHAAVITPQTGGSIDPTGGEDWDYDATGSATLVDFNALAGKVIQANWAGVSGQSGNTINHDPLDGGNDDGVDVRIDHSPANFAASASTATAYNSSNVGSGYRWTGTNGQQLTIRFGTASGDTFQQFTNDRAVKAAGLMLMNIGGAYNVAIKYYDSANTLLSSQSFSGNGDTQAGVTNGAEFFTGYVSSSANISYLTIDITRTTGTSDIGLDALTYVTGPDLLSTSPADNATDVALDTDLTATFSKNISANTGSIELRLASDNSVVESFDVTNSAEVSIVDNVVTLNPTSDLILNTTYTVEIPAGAFVAGGVETSLATWSFTPVPQSTTIDFDPTGEFTAEFSAGGYSEDTTGGLDSSVGVAINGNVQGVTSLDGPQRSWLPSGSFSQGTTMTVGAFFKASSLASGEVLRLGLTNGGTDTFAGLPYGSINWDGTNAQLDVRTGVATDPTTFPLATGQWYYFEASFTRGASNSVTYELAVANADASGNVGSTIRSFSQLSGANMDAAQQDQAIYAAFRGMNAAGVLDNFYASRVGASQLRLSYAEWIDGFFPGETNPAIIGLGADPDADGIGNGVENFFGTAPDGFSHGLAAGTVSGGTFTFTHPQGTLAVDLAASYRWSTDLQSFNADGATDGDGTKVDFTVQLDTPEAGTTTVTATVDPGGTATDKLFVDVQVTQP